MCRRGHTYTLALARTLTLYLLAHMLFTHMNQTSQVGFVPRMRTFPRIRQHKNVNFLRIVWKQSQCDGTMVFCKCVPRAFESVKRACVCASASTRVHTCSIRFRLALTHLYAVVHSPSSPKLLFFERSVGFAFQSQNGCCWIEHVRPKRRHETPSSKPTKLNQQNPTRVTFSEFWFC